MPPKAAQPSEKPAQRGELPPGGAPPEEWLRRAMAARTPLARGRHAKQGLAAHGPLDRTTHAMLLRQLSLSCYERRDFTRAQETAKKALSLGVLTDVLHHDAARAALCLADLPEALWHLRAAVRRGPPVRRAFHNWTLGSVLFLAQRYDEAAGALARAVRWSLRERPLYAAHLALVRLARGEEVADLQELVTTLAESPSGQGYGRFVLGHLAYAAGQWAAARRYLDAFLKRTEAARPALALALAGELEMSRATLSKIAKN